MAERIRIRQVRSGLGSPGDQRRTLRALGLKHHQDVVIQEDTPAVRGMIRRVSHLVTVEEVGDDG